MIDDLLRPCEEGCNDIGDILCMVCNQTYCEEHFDGHKCDEEESNQYG